VRRSAARADAARARRAHRRTARGGAAPGATGDGHRRVGPAPARRGPRRHAPALALRPRLWLRRDRLPGRRRSDRRRRRVGHGLDLARPQRGCPFPRPRPHPLGAHPGRTSGARTRRLRANRSREPAAVVVRQVGAPRIGRTRPRGHVRPLRTARARFRPWWAWWGVVALWWTVDGLISAAQVHAMRTADGGVSWPDVLVPTLASAYLWVPLTMFALW